MDQKVMELLAKIYQTQTEMRSEINELRTEFKDIRTEFKDIRTEFKDIRTEFKDIRTEFKDIRTEFKDLRTEFKDLRTEFKDIRTDQDTLALNVSKIITVIEHDVAKKIGAIFDFREIQIDHNQKTGDALGRIEAKVEVLQLETSDLRRIK